MQTFKYTIRTDHTVFYHQTIAHSLHKMVKVKALQAQNQTHHSATQLQAHYALFYLTTHLTKFNCFIMFLIQQLWLAT